MIETNRSEDNWIPAFQLNYKNLSLFPSGLLNWNANNAKQILIRFGIFARRVHRIYLPQLFCYFLFSSSVCWLDNPIYNGAAHGIYYYILFFIFSNWTPRTCWTISRNQSRRNIRKFRNSVKSSVSVCFFKSGLLGYSYCLCSEVATVGWSIPMAHTHIRWLVNRVPTREYRGVKAACPNRQTNRITTTHKMASKTNKFRHFYLFGMCKMCSQ